MRSQVTAHAVTCGRVEPPGVHQRLRVEHVVLEVGAPVAEDLADLTRFDDLSGERRDRVLQVVEPDERLHPRRLGGGRHPSRPLDARSQRLLAVDVLAGGDGSERHLLVEMVGGRDVDDIDVRILHQRAPVAGGAGEPQPLGGTGGRGRIDVGQHLETDVGGQLEHGGGGAIGKGVSLADEPAPDEPDADHRT